MGITRSAIALYAKLAAGGDMPKAGSDILEFGNQVLHCRDKALLAQLLQSVGGNTRLAESMQHGQPARILYEALGYKYDCVDITPKDNARVWDINSMLCPGPLRSKFRFVTNHGTTEHVLGQLNAFRLIHDLTSKDGIIFHTLPCTGQITHGFFRYSPEFFLALARANAYTILEYVVTDLEQVMVPYVQSMPMPAFSYVHVAYRKQENISFCAPLDCVSIPAQNLFR